MGKAGTSGSFSLSHIGLCPFFNVRNDQREREGEGKKKRDK